MDDEKGKNLQQNAHLEWDGAILNSFFCINYFLNK